MSKIKAFPILAAAFLFAAVALAANAQEASAPKHTLSPEQLAALKKINGEETNQSAPLAIELTATAREIVANMLSDKENETLRQKLNTHLHQMAGQMLDIKGQSFRRMIAILTPDQRSLLRAEAQKPTATSNVADLIDRVFDLTSIK